MILISAHKVNRAETYYCGDSETQWVDFYSEKSHIPVAIVFNSPETTIAVLEDVLANIKAQQAAKAKAEAEV